MKSALILITLLINLFNPIFIKSEERVYKSSDNKLKNSNEESQANENHQIKGVHIVNLGDTIMSISKLYSVDKKVIIELNDLKDENYIYVGQNLIISNEYIESQKNLHKKSAKNYHVVQIGENLTDISNKYNLKLANLIEINNLNNPDSIKIGERILLNKNNSNKDTNLVKIGGKVTKQFITLDEKTYGPITIQSISVEKINNRKILNSINKDFKKLFLSINCETRELDVRIPGRKWRGSKPAKADFEKNLINDFC